MLLVDKEYIQYENYFLDGTKIEANANKYSYVYKKNTKRYHKAVQWYSDLGILLIIPIYDLFRLRHRITVNTGQTMFQSE
jgi:hypothetical protein